MKYWINTIAKEHIIRGVKGGFTQANHGKLQGVKQLQKGDLIVFYSGKTAYPDGKTYQKFTAMGRVADDEPYQVEMTPAFHLFRCNVEFYKIDEADIKPLIEELSFIKDPSHWGFPFMRGLFEIPGRDSEKIATACGASRYLNQ